MQTSSSIVSLPNALASKRQQSELLTTKLSIPASRPTLIPRDSLIAKLNNGLRRGCRLTLISALAGAGKTTLLSIWMRQLAALSTATSQEQASRSSGLGLAWLALDRADNQPVRFWSYLIGALQTIDSDLGREAHRLLVAPQRWPIQAVLCALLNDIAAYADPIILVLDAFETIAASAIHKGLVFIVDHAPAHLHLVLSSRAEPPLPLARFRAHDQLAELRSNELSFTLDETTALLSGLTGMAWRAQDAWGLHARTEGWVAGIQIAGLELQKLLADLPIDRVGDEIARFTACFSGHHHDIHDFLESEVLHRQPQPVQAFLIYTSILERLNGSLCDAIIQQTGSHELLEQLARANLVIGPLEGAGSWYRYHRMVAEVLQTRLCQSQPDLLPTLRRRADEWYDAHGDTADSLFAGYDARLVDALIDVTHRLAREPATPSAASDHANAGANSPTPDSDDAFVPLAEQLTPREREVLQLISEGLSYLEISQRLVIGLNTVRFHVKNVYGKLQAHQRIQAIARAKALHILHS